MNYDVIVIGAGLSGLTAASLLAKRKLNVCVVEAQNKPGGACGIFKRKDVVFEQGVGMIYGFNDKGFSPHRFVFNALEEPIDIIKHNELYAVNYGEHRIVFYEDLDRFIEELAKVFPKEKDNFKRFYRDLSRQYMKIIAEKPNFISPDAIKKEQGLQGFLRHPVEYIRFLGYMNKNTTSILKKYFKDEKVFNLFDKLTSTYCYTNVEETPAILSSVMFVDNHFGGSYYPAGSTLNLVGKLEKVIEENNGKMIYNREAEKIIVENNTAVKVRLDDGSVINAKYIINSGTVWNLYNKLLKDNASEEIRKWTESLEPSYPSVVLYALVKEKSIPEGTLPIEMLIGDKTKLDESEITAYILSIDDKTLCPAGYHTIAAIGPSFKKWPKGYKNDYNTQEYKDMKEAEKNRILDVLEKRFPGFKENICHVEVSTPTTLNRYVLKEGGSVAGPKQKLGQHMMKRLKTKSEIKNLFNCGESTVMGTGTPAVTISGISAANLILRELGMKEFEYDENMKNYVNIVKKPFERMQIRIGKNPKEEKIAKLALECQFCDKPLCEKACRYNVPIRDINRRAAVGNFVGAMNLLKRYDSNPCIKCDSKDCESHCIRRGFAEEVSIKEINSCL
ncbi:FAD-dependent oxidoreductase [Clostridium sp. NSJ-49]|uniref:phytoene desaturase family protein n=1 Tax=Clostridium TaxID=1485 RepID=UPI00164C72EF|nr:MULTISPECIES: NAD(P)/FAD-dependent oxidoreductase [unclassified Clostridium]MBC5626277.1 FAD-dependent oxidoreductase [Clostridium sp. NSJ-49]MCD2503110.1 FAD-dependent oxidoreductase [Clostridium sp. NSJ-145]MDU6340321.1 FAD-dependent oxidoreductase [Clostridium sp.]